MERITKLMAARGLCSRREAERLIEAGEVVVDGVVVREQGVKALPDADIRITPGGMRLLGGRITIALHKPIGVVSAQPEPGQREAWTLIRPNSAQRPADRGVLPALGEPSSLSVAGRLDRASRGLLILTQDGTVARRIIGGEGVEKEYFVRTAEPPTDGQIRRLNGSLELDGEALLPMRVSRGGEPDVLRFVLVEGKKHQIRRLCRRFGLAVVDLLRTAVGPISLDGLAEGRWRVVESDEIDRLRRDGRVARPDHGRQKARGKRQKAKVARDGSV